MSNTMTNDDAMAIFDEAFGSTEAEVSETEVSETPEVESGSVSIPTEDSPLPPQDEEENESDEEDEDSVSEVSVRFVFPNRKNPNPDDIKKFLVKLEVPIAHDLAEKTAKRITSLTRAELRGLRDIVKESDSYKAANEEQKKAMLSTVKVKATAVLAKYLGISSLADKLQTFATEAQEMTFETTSTEKTGLSLKKAREQMANAYVGMIAAYVQMGLASVPSVLVAQLKRFNIDPATESVQDAIFSALVHPDYGGKSRDEATEFVSSVRTECGQTGAYTPPAEDEAAG